MVYLENAEGKPGQPPLFVKAVRIDAFLTPEHDNASAWDADMLGISDLQPVHWDGDALIDFLLGTRYGAYVFHSDMSRKEYPRLQLRTNGAGIPVPLLPPSWRAVGCRLNLPYLRSRM